MALRIGVEELELKRGEQSGVRVWWPLLPGRKRPVLCVAWETLILIGPSLVWHELFWPKLVRSPGWGQARMGFRVVWIPHPMGRLMVEPQALAPVLAPCFSGPRTQWPRLRRVNTYLRYHKARYQALETRAGDRVYLWKTDAERLRQGLQMERDGEDDVEFRRAVVGDRPSLFVYKQKKLRAVASLLRAEDVEAA